MTGSKGDAARYVLDDAGEGVEVMSARFVRHAFAPHLHDGLMVGLIVEGAQRFEREGRTFVAGPGSLSLVNPGEWHTGEPHPHTVLSYQAIYPARSRPGSRYRPGVIEDQLVYAAWRRYLDGVREHAPRLERDVHLAEALALMERRHGDTAPSPPAYGAIGPRLTRVRDLIHANFAQPLPLADLAREAGVSRRHLMRDFRKRFGASIHAYQTTVRIRVARDQLKRGEAIAAVAADVGFADQSQLTRRFKQLFGYTPGAFRRAWADPGRSGVRRQVG